MLTTEEAARRLGVKVPTLYAYVSRGSSSRTATPTARGSLFDLDDVEALATRSRGGRQTATRLATITTGVTQLDQELGPALPGPARHRAGGRRASFEEVAELLWQSEAGAGDWSTPDLGACPLGHTFDRMRWALVVCGAPRPAPLRPAAVGRGPGGPPIGRRPGRRGGARTRRRRPRLDRGAPRRPPDAVLPPRVPDRRGQRRARPAGRPRVGDLDDGRPRGGVGAGRSLRRAPGRAGDAGRARCTAGPAKWPTSSSSSRNGTAPCAPSTPCCANRAGCPGSATPSTRAATRGSARCSRWPSRRCATDQRAVLHEVIALAAAHDVPLPNCDLALAALELGHRHAARQRAHDLRRRPGGRLGRALHGGADRAAAALPGPRRLQHLSGGGPAAPRPLSPPR